MACTVIIEDNETNLKLVSYLRGGAFGRHVASAVEGDSRLDEVRRNPPARRKRGVNTITEQT